MARSSDHGGVGTKHGGETLAEIEIPFILIGPGVKQGCQITHQVMTYDNAALWLKYLAQKFRMPE